MYALKRIAAYVIDMILVWTPLAALIGYDEAPFLGRLSPQFHIFARLGATALAFGAATAAMVVRQAAAQQKISPAIANYQGTLKGNDHCQLCNNFQPPNTCKFVQGQISPNGWCQLFSPKA